MKISITHPDITEISFKIDSIERLACHNCCTLELNLDFCRPVKLIVNFKPFGVKPLLRIDGFLMDYWLAGVKQQDHQIELDIDADFLNRYSIKDRKGRLDSLGPEQKQTDHYLDKYIGINNLYPELIREIQELLDEKSSPCKSSKN
jgi:hypothetical protein